MYDYFDRAPPSRRLFGPSPGDKLLESAQSVRLELMRYTDDDDKPAVSCSYKLAGCLDVAPDVQTGELLLGILKALRAPRMESDGAA